ncbi:MAG: DNA primase [Oscillospiraceae bacterium]|nr:DNA primase [Oscillospiraceae bacterium]
MVRYSDELIDQVRDSSDIVDIISQYVILKRSGRNFFGVCPFHKEKTPSFSVSPDKQIFHCFGCGAGGNVIHFVNKIENMGFKETIEMLADRAGIVLPTILVPGEDNSKLQLKEKVYQINEKASQFYHEKLYKPTSKVAQDYIKKRKLGNETLKTFLIGYSDGIDQLYKHLKEQGFSDEEILASSLVNKNQRNQYIDRFRNRLIFPIQDIKNRVIAFGGRILDDSLPKYINSPENIVYSKGRNLYALNIAKKNSLEKMIVVEGYMDVVSLYQRGVTNVVASLGTALTEAQGRLLRKYSEKAIIAYDSDEAGKQAALRGLDILTNLGVDVRILQMEDAKDPDEYVIKYGNAKFNALVEKAISLVEFKVKMLKGDLNLEAINDKIKFLNEIAKLLSTVTNKIEQEIYIEKIAKEYNISKESIYAEVNKLNYAHNKGEKILQRPVGTGRVSSQSQNDNVPKATVEREELAIAVLINHPETYSKIKEKIVPDDFKLQENKKIIQKLYEELEKGNSNINNIINYFSEEEKIVSIITKVVSNDYKIKDVQKAIVDILTTYEKEKLLQRKNEIIHMSGDKNINKDTEMELLKELQEITIKLAKL